MCISFTFNIYPAGFYLERFSECSKAFQSIPMMREVLLMDFSAMLKRN